MPSLPVSMVIFLCINKVCDDAGGKLSDFVVAVDISCQDTDKLLPYLSSSGQGTGQESLHTGVFTGIRFGGLEG